MRKKQPTQLDVRSIFDAVRAAQEEVPELWTQHLAWTFAASDWHIAQPEGRYVFHASSLASCNRKEWYKRHGAPREEERVESFLTFQVGTFWHALFQFGLAVHPEYELLGHEIGGYHSELPLAAHCDAVFRTPDGITVLVDLKTEKSFSGKMRREQSKETGSFIKEGHAIQVACTAVVLEDQQKIHVDEAWVIYINKDDESIDQQQIENLEEWIAKAGEMMANKDMATVSPQEVPERIELTNKSIAWQCSPRSDTDPRGKWCPYREQCRGGNTE